MSNTSQHTSISNAYKGPAVIALVDDETNNQVMIGKVDEIEVSRETTVEVLTEIVNGREVEVDASVVKEVWGIKGKLKEVLDPNTIYLVMKNCGSITHLGDCSIRQITEETPMYFGRQIQLRHKDGFYGIGVLPEPNNVEAFAQNLTPDIPGFSAAQAGGYVFGVVAVYEGGACSNAMVIPYVTIAENESVLIDISPATAAAPEYYRIYAYKAGNGGTLTLWATTSLSEVWFNEPVVGGDPYPGDETTSFTVTSLDGLTVYEPGVHYTIDSVCAMLCLIAPEDGIDDPAEFPCNGETLKITFSQVINPSVEMRVGPSNRNPKFGHLVILAKGDDDRVTPVGKGLEWEFFKVLMESSFSLPLSGLNFEAGYNFDWKALFDDNNLCHGKIRSFSRLFECYDVREYAALSRYAIQDACDTGTTGGTT